MTPFRLQEKFVCVGLQLVVAHELISNNLIKIYALQILLETPVIISGEILWLFFFSDHV